MKSMGAKAIDFRDSEPLPIRKNARASRALNQSREDSLSDRTSRLRIDILSALPEAIPTPISILKILKIGPLSKATRLRYMVPTSLTTDIIWKLKRDWL